MSEKDFSEFKNILLKKREELVCNINSLRNNMLGLQSSEANDDADFAMISSDSLVDKTLMNKLEGEIEEIDFITSKIENRTYGICEMCEEQIEIQRLRVKPHARYCVDCRELVEKINHTQVKISEKSLATV